MPEDEKPWPYDGRPPKYLDKQPESASVPFPNWGAFQTTPNIYLPVHEPETPAERRRYALLNAAAAIYSASLLKYDACEVSVQPHYWETPESSVAIAEMLLKGIESLEKL